MAAKFSFSQSKQPQEYTSSLAIDSFSSPNNNYSFTKSTDFKGENEFDFLNYSNVTDSTKITDSLERFPYSFNPFLLLREIQQGQIRTHVSRSLVNEKQDVLVLDDLNLEVDLTIPTGLVSRKNESYSLGDIHLLLTTPKEEYYYSYATTQKGQKFLSVLERNKVINALNGSTSSGGVSSFTSTSNLATSSLSNTSSPSLPLELTLKRFFAYIHDNNLPIKLPKDSLWISREDSTEEDTTLEDGLPWLGDLDDLLNSFKNKKSERQIKLELDNDDNQNSQSNILDSNDFNETQFSQIKNKINLISNNESTSNKTNKLTTQLPNINSTSTKPFSISPSNWEDKENMIWRMIYPREVSLSIPNRSVCPPKTLHIEKITQKFDEVEKSLQSNLNLRKYSHLPDSSYRTQIETKLRKIRNKDKLVTLDTHQSRNMHPDDQKSRQKISATLCVMDICIKNKSPPIIIIPSTPNAIFNRNNFLEFFQNEKFVDPIEATKTSTHEAVSQKYNGILIEHFFKSKLRKFLAIESRYTSRFSEKDWDNVVCVFLHGGRWQFQGWPFEDFTNLFLATKGCLFLYETDTVPQEVSNWSIKILRISRIHRYKDSVVCREFWNLLEEFLLSPRIKSANFNSRLLKDQI